MPLIISVNGHPPISKVEVRYEPHPKNTFLFRVNDEDLYSLTKEEVDFDPSKTEPLNVTLKVNEIEAISALMPYIIDEVEDKIQSALGMN